MTMTKEEWFALDFPYTDDIGCVWIDHTGWLADTPGLCFICKQETKRLDIDFAGYYCGSNECEEQIRKDLEDANRFMEARAADEAAGDV